MASAIRSRVLTSSVFVSAPLLVAKPCSTAGLVAISRNMLGTTPSCLCTASRIGFDASGTSLRAGTARRDMEISFGLHACIGVDQRTMHHSTKSHNTVILEVILPKIGKTMDRFEAMPMLLTVVERGSLSAAGGSLGGPVPRPRRK